MKHFVAGVILMGMLVFTSDAGQCGGCTNTTVMGPDGQIQFCVVCCGQAGCNVYCY